MPILYLDIYSSVCAMISYYMPMSTETLSRVNRSFVLLAWLG